MQLLLRFVCSLFGIGVVAKSRRGLSSVEDTDIRDSMGQLDLALEGTRMTPVEDSTSQQGSPRLLEYQRKAGTITKCNPQKGDCT